MQISGDEIPDLQVKIADSERTPDISQGPRNGLSQSLRLKARSTIRYSRVFALLAEISRLAETTPRKELLDPATPQGSRLVDLIDALRRRPA
jgi:hypothetical protein